MFRRATQSGHNAKAFISEKLSDVTISPPSQTQGKDPEFGSNPITKTFYEGKGSGGGCYNWVETPPKQLKEKTQKAYDRVAIKLYKIRDQGQNTIAGRTPLKIHAIDIQSPFLVTALKPFVEEVGVFLDEHDIAKFTEPFKPLYFCYDKIFALGKETTKDNVFESHLTLLTQLIAELFGTTRRKLRNLRESQLINYELAWTYFAKDAILFCGAEDCERLFRVLDTAYCCDSSGKRLEISCKHIVFTGATFEWETTFLKIPAFGGNVPITNLPHYPLEYHPNVEALKARLAIRGTKILDYQGIQYREYTGTGLNDGCKKYNVSGEQPLISLPMPLWNQHIAFNYGRWLGSAQNV